MGYGFCVDSHCFCCGSNHLFLHSLPSRGDNVDIQQGLIVFRNTHFDFKFSEVPSLLSRLQFAVVMSERLLTLKADMP